jgi:hypothetical protein
MTPLHLHLLSMEILTASLHHVSVRRPRSHRRKSATNSSPTEWLNSGLTIAAGKGNMIPATGRSGPLKVRRENVKV